MLNKIVSFFKESYQELQKVTWPTRDEAVNSAIITIGFIVLFSLFLAFVDNIFRHFIVWLVR